MNTYEINNRNEVIPYTSGRRCSDTRAWRDATELELQQQDAIKSLETELTAVIKERDEARAEMAAIKAMLLDPVEVELDMIRGNIAIPARPEFGGVYDTGKAMANLIRDRDEAREQLALTEKNLEISMQQTKQAVQDRADEHVVLIRDRDEARGQRDRLAEALQKVVTAWDLAEWLDENDFESFRATLQSLTTNESISNQ